MSTPPIEKHIPVSALSIDRRVQREEFNPKKVENIVANFNPAALGIISVSERDDGSLVIVDGWHRWEAYRRISDNAGQLRCDVYSGLTLSEEAELFLLLNNTNHPKAMDKFKVRVFGGEPFANEVNNWAKTYGWSVDAVVGDGHVNAVAVLEKVHRLSLDSEADPALLQMVFVTIRDAWGHDRYGAQAPVLAGLGALFAEHGSKINLDRLVQVLRTWKGGPEGLITNARTQASILRMKTGYALAFLVTRAYNEGLRTNALPEWRVRR